MRSSSAGGGSHSRSVLRLASVSSSTNAVSPRTTSSHVSRVVWQCPSSDFHAPNAPAQKLATPACTASSVSAKPTMLFARNSRSKSCSFAASNGCARHAHAQKASYAHVSADVSPRCTLFSTFACASSTLATPARIAVTSPHHSSKLDTSAPYMKQSILVNKPLAVECTVANSYLCTQPQHERVNTSYGKACRGTGLGEERAHCSMIRRSCWPPSPHNSSGLNSARR